MSDHVPNSDQGVYKRTDFEKYFTSPDAKNKSDAYKIFFMDACRGKRDSFLIGHGQKGNKNKAEIQKWTHPEANKCVMHANMNTYYGYEVQFDRKLGDIAWDRMKEGNIIDDNDPRCGYFLNGVYKAFARNARNGYNMSFADMQDYMRECTSRGVPLLDENDKVTKDMVGLEIEES